MDHVIRAENLRALAMTFADEVLHLPPAADEPLNWELHQTDDYFQLLNDVALLFSTRPDGAGAGAHSTRARLEQLVISYIGGHLLRSRLHAQVCILLIGHADLFNRFENLQVMNDGLEGTHRQIREWREDVRYAVMPEINMVLANCSNTIGILTLMPDALDRRTLAFIANTCLTEGLDVNDRYHVLLNLVRDPASVRNVVLPTLEAAQTRFRQMDRLLTLYFGQVVSMAL